MINGIFLTKYNGAILGPIARILGVVINYIFEFLDKIGIPNVGLSIIIFTIFIYIILLPLTFKQQKFSKLSAIMNPEIQAIQAKYKGKNDNESMAKQNEELQAVYKKYGVSPTGSCIQLVIQMPILFALYRVIYNVPAYIDKVYNALNPLADGLLKTSDGSSFMQSLDTARYFQKSDFTAVNTIIDMLNRATSAEWDALKNHFPDLLSVIESTQTTFLKYYSFGPINIADSPQVILKAGLSTVNVGMIIGAVLVPLLAALSQWLNVLFMPQANSGNDNSAMASSMKTMNIMMPVMSAVFCFTLPAGLGLYWIASAVVRCVEQVAINKYFDKIGVDDLIKKNQEKLAKSEEKKKEVSSATLKSGASVNARNYDSIKNIPSYDSNREIKKGSMAEKANLVKKYNEENK